MNKLIKRIEYWNNILRVINFPYIDILHVSQDEYWKFVRVGTINSELLLNGSPEQVVEKLDNFAINMLADMAWKYYEATI